MTAAAEGQASSAPIRVHYYRVHDTGYPRNARIRRYLASLDGVSVGVARPSTRRNRVLRLLEDLGWLLRDARRSDLLVLSEMRLVHAGIVGLIGRFTRVPVIVDGFIGLHETTVGDRKDVPERSARAWLLRRLDALAVRSSDLYLTDTEVRAEAIRARFPTAAVLALPVGAPAWAVPRVAPRLPALAGSMSATPVGTVDRPLRVLYYGNYIPLHGLDLVVDALVRLPERLSFHLTLIGDGRTRDAIEQRVRIEGFQGSCTFLPTVPERELAAHIAAADVVLGVFGASEKARTVIANKVWQGLACGKTTITQRGEAIGEIADLAGPQLILTEMGSARSIADALERCADSDLAGGGGREAAATLHIRLERHVIGRFDAFGSQVRALAARRSRVRS